MTWQEVRDKFPGRWLVMEALRAHTQANERIVEEMSVVGAFESSIEAMRLYASLHHEQPYREMFVSHTSREALNIEARFGAGVRA